MNSARGSGLLAGWALAGAVLAQTPTPSNTAALPGTPDQANPATYPAPHAADARAERQSGGTRDPVHIGNGMKVQSRSGQPLGTVVNIVPDAGGQPGYVVVADSAGDTRAIPYPQVRPLVRGSELVVDEKRLRAAPTVSQTRLLNPRDSAWQQEADRYWQQGGHDRF